MLDYRSASPTEILLAQRAIADTSSERATNPPAAPNDSLRPPTPKSPNTKSIGRAFVSNLVIPGTGSLYAGYQRGWIHIGIEGLTWVTYFYYHDRGNTKENEFEAYADDHWNYQTWIDSCGCAGTPADITIQTFYATNKQQYYEDIGKIPTYFSGWDDWDSSSGTTLYGDSANRQVYRGIREDSNDFFKKSRYALAVGFVNRIVSAVDVLRLMRKAQRVNLNSDTSLRINMHTKPFSSENGFGLQITKKI